MYKRIIRPILFLFDPETVHIFTTNFLKAALRIGPIKSWVQNLYKFDSEILEKELFGLRFKNPIGLAAGFDKDATIVDELSCFGFGFIEIGTLTPKPQAGNPRPRLFRLKTDGALINRMGFNNEGVLDAVDRLKRRSSKVIIGGNIGKNKDTENDYAFRDYEYCFEALHDVVDYFVVNVSSPNTPDLRQLQEKEPLKKLLGRMKDRLNDRKSEIPVLLKIAPDLNEAQLNDIIEIVEEVKLDGLIATNTTIDRSGLQTDSGTVEKIGAGGLSGKPVNHKSTEVIRYLRSRMGTSFPIIGVGGVFSPADAKEKLDAGADLVQVYTGFVYEGPSMVKKINKFLDRELRKGES